MFWVTLFLLTAGFLKLATIILNRWLALRHPKWLIGASEVFQFSLIPVYVWLTASELSPLRSRPQFELVNFLSLSPLGMMLVAIGAVGLMGLLVSTIAYQRYRPPVCQISTESEILDFRRREGEPTWRNTLVGPRPMRRVALLPGNEQFVLEVNTKTLALPRLPHDWDGLSIVHLADTHFRGAVSRAYFEAVFEEAEKLKPDLYVFTGDLLDDTTLCSWISSTFGRLDAPLGKYFILGNHDSYDDPSGVRAEMQRNQWIDLSGQVRELASPKRGSSLVIAGDETPWMGAHPDLSTEPNAEFRLLVSHTPDNIPWAREHGVDLMLAGHTHGGQIRLPILGPVYSPSLFGCRFASGTFWLEPTLMHVSRGISGREPVRFLCKPELTKLVLRAATT